MEQTVIRENPHNPCSSASPSGLASEESGSARRTYLIARCTGRLLPALRSGPLLHESGVRVPRLLSPPRLRAAVPDCSASASDPTPAQSSHRPAAVQAP